VHPWKHNQTWSVGGLWQVGFAEDSDLLIVLTHSGRGIFDCLTGERVARDYTEGYEFFNQVKLTVQGFGPLEGQLIHTSGLYGGGLLRLTEDYWQVEDDAKNSRIYLRPPSNSEDHFTEAAPIGDYSVVELRAYGFSETGRSLVIATSADLTIFSRVLP